MKHAVEFLNNKHKYLSPSEEVLIKKSIGKILSNPVHADDEWWEIELGIRSAIDRVLEDALINAEFSEKQDREIIRRGYKEAEKEKLERESDKIIADMLDKNAERMHELKDKIKNGDASPNNIGEDGGPTIEYRIHSYNDYGAHGELPKSDHSEGGE